jgi:hypothetical protein
VQDRDDRIREQLARWRDDLLDLRKNNRLLRFQHYKTSSLEFIRPSAQEIVDRLLTGRSREWPIYLPEDVDEATELPLAFMEPIGEVLVTTKESAREIGAACAEISRKAAQAYMDQGLWILYLGIGMLRWSDPADQSGERQDSPLLLVPVRLEVGKGGIDWKLLPSEEEPVVNPALWWKLESELEIELPTIDPDDPIDVAATLAAVRLALSEQRDWTVDERVVLSPFSFHKQVMYRDLRDNFNRIAEHPIVVSLAAEPGAARDGGGFSFEPVDEARLDAAFPPEQSAAIRDADASQRQCIAAARQGRSFVMDGPPGTGKSQTIANMIAELAADGKTVLFVSEKAAALDVVHNRLAEVGLDEYVLELHSHKTTRAKVAAALGASLLRRPKATPAVTEYELVEAQRRREELSRYADTLNAPMELLGGRSLHHLLGWIAQLQHLPQAPVAPNPPSGQEELSTIRELGEQLAATWTVVERGEDFLWRGATADSWGASVEQRIVAKLTELVGRLDMLRQVSDAIAEDLVLDPPAGPNAALSLAAVLRHLAARPVGVAAGWLTDADRRGLSAAATRTAERARRFDRCRTCGLELIGERWQEVGDRRAADICDGLERLGIKLPQGLDAEEAARLACAAEQSSKDAQSLTATVEELATTFGLRATGISLADVDVALQLVSILHEDVRPPERWLAGEQQLAAAATAVERMTPLLRVEAEARAAAAIFEPAVLELDLESLAARFREQHRGIRKLSSAYRADRDALAATAASVKPKAAIAALDAALAWQTARRSLEDAARSEADALVGAWNGVDTEIAPLEAKLALARFATSLTDGRIADRRRFAAVISGTRQPGDLPELAARADGILARLRAGLPKEFAPLVEHPLAAAAAELWQVAALLGAAVEIGRVVDQARSHPASVADALTATIAANDANDLRQELAEDAQAGRALGSWASLEIDADALEQAIAWSAELLELLNSAPSRLAAERLAAAQLEVTGIDDALNAWRAALKPLLAEFDVEHRRRIAEDLEYDFDDAGDFLQRLRETRGEIKVWIAHASAVEALHRHGLEQALGFCIEHHLPTEVLPDVLRRSALEALADRVLADRADVLGPLGSGDRDRLVREFARRDRAIIDDAHHRVVLAANARRPTTILGVATIIANEAEKKKKHMPVATLLAKTAPVAQAVKPVFMMSPLSVSQFLSPDMHFDVVIFDEASQVRPSDAINAIYRADAMIVAGDQKQLPPTSFFEHSVDGGDGWNVDGLPDFDSVLDLAKGSGEFQSLSLRWHYRSQHESLIAFSNRRFYGGELVTFPGATEHADDLGVELMLVDGVYRRGTGDNPIEAKAVVDRIFTHAEHDRTSIGVVAFNEPQASLIEELVRRDPRREEPRFAKLFSEDRLDGLFIKNLENVQGDERDIVVFSVGYGPDENGKLTMNFGPLNKEGGWRRLNVAITRARRRVKIVASFGAERITPTGARGVDELRRYLDYAARGPVVLEVDSALDPGGEPESPFEEAVVRTVRSWGYDVACQVGTAGYRIDLAIRHPDHPSRFALGVECDGAMYHSSRVARDRDRLREQVLAGLGWKLHRIWGPSWYHDRPGEERRLHEAIERSLSADEGSGAGATAAPRRPVVLEFEPLARDAAPSWTNSYEVAVLERGRAFDPTMPEARSELRIMILKTVDVEGPIVDDLLARRVIGAWRMSLTEKRRVAVQQVLKDLLGAGTLVRCGNAVATPTQPTDVVRVPQDFYETSGREVRHVPEVELTEAVAKLVAEGRIITGEELRPRTARLFGWKRNGPAIQAALNRAVEDAIQSGRVIRADGYLEPSDQPAAAEDAA